MGNPVLSPYFLGENFVTRKVTRSVAQVHLGHRESVSLQLHCSFVNNFIFKNIFLVQFSLGNLESQRDWGHAKDYVEV